LATAGPAFGVEAAGDAVAGEPVVVPSPAVVLGVAPVVGGDALEVVTLAFRLAAVED